MINDELNDLGGGRVKKSTSNRLHLFNTHLHLVDGVAWGLASKLPSYAILDHSDLLSVGRVGLWNATKTYDPKLGSTFHTYATVRIRGDMMDELRRMDEIPRSVRTAIVKINNARIELEQNLGRRANDYELAQACKMTVEQLHHYWEMKASGQHQDLDASTVEGADENCPTLHEVIEDETILQPLESLQKKEWGQALVEAMLKLSPIQREIISLYYFEDLRLREIAEIYGVTESRICQIHAQALFNIKNLITQNGNGHLNGNVK